MAQCSGRAGRLIANMRVRSSGPEPQCFRPHHISCRVSSSSGCAGVSVIGGDCAHLLFSAGIKFAEHDGPDAHLELSRSDPTAPIVEPLAALGWVA